MTHRPHVCIMGTGFHFPWVEGYSAIGYQLMRILSDDVQFSEVSLLRRDLLRFDPGASNARLVDSVFSRNPQTMRILRSCILSQALLKSFRRVDTTTHVDIVHLFNVSHVLNAHILWLSARKPVVVHVCGSASLGDLLSRRAVAAFLCTTKSSYRFLSENVSSKKVFYVPPIFDPRFVADANVSNMSRERSLGTPDRPLTITYMGNLFPGRFPPALVEEFEKLTCNGQRPKFNLYAPEWAPNTTFAAGLRRYISLCKNRWSIHVTDLALEAKIRIFKSSDVVIFPFARDPGSIVCPPMTLLESMACGCVVVATKSADMTDVIVDGKNGFLVEPNDSTNFVDVVRYVTGNNQAALNSVREAAKRTIEKAYSPYVLTKNVLNIYRSLLRDRSASRE